MNDPLPTLRALLAGCPVADVALSSAVRLEINGRESFGAAGVVARLAADPVLLTPTPHVVGAPRGFAVLDWDHAGRAVAVFADLQDGLITRLWRIDCRRSAPARTPSERWTFEPAHAGVRAPFVLDAPLYPDLPAAGGAALTEAVRELAQAAGSACTSPLVLRAFGGDGRGAALLAIGSPGASTGAVFDYAVVAYRYDDERLLHLVTIPELHSRWPVGTGLRSAP